MFSRPVWYFCPVREPSGRTTVRAIGSTSKVAKRFVVFTLRNHGKQRPAAPHSALVYTHKKREVKNNEKDYPDV